MVRRNVKSPLLFLLPFNVSVGCACMTADLRSNIEDFFKGSTQPLLVLVGPTASGKTAFSVELALELSKQGPPSLLRSSGGARREVEIINADSRQLYEYLDIGTAKVTDAEMRGIPHHLLSVLDPKEEVTAAWYKREAERVIDEIHARGNIPFLVGGSMLYVSAITDNLQFVERPDPKLREQLNRELSTLGAEELYERLQTFDPEGALSIDPRNPVYLLRALEVCLTSGMALAEAKKRQPSPYDLFILGLDLPRAELHRRIAERTERMFAEGWAEEVSALLRRGYSVNDPGLLSHGYREIAEALSSGRSPAEVKADQALRDQITAKTRQYARRQLTWWRRDSRIHWIVTPRTFPGESPRGARGGARDPRACAAFPR
jgi:tRNA dimethylallyltransferase